MERRLWSNAWCALLAADCCCSAGTGPQTPLIKLPCWSTPAFWPANHSRSHPRTCTCKLERHNHLHAGTDMTPWYKCVEEAFGLASHKDANTGMEGPALKACWTNS